MCLATVYLDEKSDDKVVLSDVAALYADGPRVVIQTLFGEAKSIEGYMIGEINLTDNFVILRKETHV